MTNYIGLSGELEIINSKYATKLLLNPVTSELEYLRDRLRLCAILTYVMSQAAHFFHFQLAKLQSDLFNVCMFDGSWFPQWHLTKNTKRPTRLWKGNFPDYEIYASHSHQLQRFFSLCPIIYMSMLLTTSFICHQTVVFVAVKSLYFIQYMVPQLFCTPFIFYLPFYQCTTNVSPNYSLGSASYM